MRRCYKCDNAVVKWGNGCDRLIHIKRLPKEPVLKLSHCYYRITAFPNYRINAQHS